MRHTWSSRPSAEGRTVSKEERRMPEGAAASWRDLGRDALASGDPAEALWYLRHAVEIDPDDPLTWRLLARGFELIGAHERAKKCYRVASRQSGAPAPQRQPRDT